MKIVTLFNALRHVNQLHIHIKRCEAARGPVTRSYNLKDLAARGPYFKSPAYKGFVDWIETNSSLGWIMISEFDYKRPYTRDDLENIYASLMAGGVSDRDIIKTFASRSSFLYLARAIRRGEHHDIIVFTLKEHWEHGQELPVESGTAAV